jgi:hypothetical protein
MFHQERSSARALLRSVTEVPYRKKFFLENNGRYVSRVDERLKADEYRFAFIPCFSLLAATNTRVNDKRAQGVLKRT